MIIALCSGQGRTFEAVVRILGPHVSQLICDQVDAPVLRRAQQLGVPAQCIDRKAYPNRKAHELAVVQSLKDSAPFRIVALLGYMRILSGEFLDIFNELWPQAEIINLHPAPLSLYQGPHGLHHAVESRAPHWGVSVHKVIPELDAGPLLSYRPLDVFPTDSFETLRERAHPLEVSAVLEAIDKLTQRSFLP